MAMNATPTTCPYSKEGDVARIPVPKAGVTLIATSRDVRFTNVLKESSGCPVEEAVEALNHATLPISREVVWTLHRRCGQCHRDVSFDLAE